MNHACRMGVLHQRTWCISERLRRRQPADINMAASNAGLTISSENRDCKPFVRKKLYTTYFVAFKDAHSAFWWEMWIWNQMNVNFVYKKTPQGNFCFFIWLKTLNLCCCIPPLICCFPPPHLIFSSALSTSSYILFICQCTSCLNWSFLLCVSFRLRSFVYVLLWLSLSESAGCEPETGEISLLSWF